MMNRKVISGFFIFLCFSLPCLGAEDAFHTVKRGETIYSIARSYNVDRDVLMRFNGLSDPSKLQAGQRLKIPGAASPEPAGVKTVEGSYKAVRGDTLYGIARRFDLSVDALLSANSLASSYVLKDGDVLRIPGAASGASSSRITAAPEADRTLPADRTPPPARTERPEVRAEVLSLRWPVNARELNYLTGKLSGVAITGERTEAVKSLTQGTVISAGPYRGFGRVAIVQVEGGYLYVYGGCESLSVQEGDKVGPGTELGRLGIEAVSGKPKLYFMVYRSNTPVDPAKAPRA